MNVTNITANVVNNITNNKTFNNLIFKIGISYSNLLGTANLKIRIETCM